MNLEKILADHRMWLADNSKGARADLSGANLSGADLRGADLRGADLSSANLSGADLDYRIISITQIGSRNGITTFDTKNNIIWCGCFTGSIEEFELRVLETHSDNEVFRNEYLNAITFFKTFL